MIDIAQSQVSVFLLISYVCGLVVYHYRRFRRQDIKHGNAVQQCNGLQITGELAGGGLLLCGCACVFVCECVCVFFEVVLV